MTLPQPSATTGGKLSGADTIVSYPRGDIANTGIVLHVEPLGIVEPDIEGATDAVAGPRWAVLLDTTCCHPVDAGWPDQGADRGEFQLAASVRPILDCVIAASDGQRLYLGADIPVRKGTEGWAFCVAHIVDDPSGIAEGHHVDVVIDEEYRHALSAGHTACHLASLALNRALAGRWSKETREDALGQPDFDAAAIESSLIVEFGSVDSYRLNKSLRRKGFSSDGLAEQLPELAAEVAATLATWVATAAPVHVETEGPRLTDRRFWVCELPEATARIACGGTHVQSLSELGAIGVELALNEIDGTLTLTMATVVTPA